jgi:hypothetical protein
LAFLRLSAHAYFFGTALAHVVIQEQSLATPMAPSGLYGLDDGAESFTEQHRIRSYEVGPDQRTSIVTIANLLQVNITFLTAKR